VLNTLGEFQSRYLSEGGTVLDVGSMNVGCRWSGRDLWNKLCKAKGLWRYTGADIAPGRNVDMIITEGEFHLGQEYDVVMSCGTLEHTKRPWITFASMARHVKKGGFLYSICPWVFRYHAYPIDGWRISPDGFRVLCEDNGLQCVQAYLYKSTYLKCRSFAELFYVWNDRRHHVTYESVVIARK
jgi:hypothetical protein